MKYELGDKVKIKKYWKQQDREEQLEKLGISELGKYLMSDDMAGGFIHIDKYKKNDINEVGYICGVRVFKVSYDLGFSIADEPYETDGIQQVDYQMEQTYLVATRMNGLRRVSFEDIEFIK